MMRPLLLLLLCAWLPACVLFQRPPRPVHAPPQEAASFTWPKVLPSEGRQILSGTTLVAIQLAMEDFLPWDIKPHQGATPTELCLYKRDSYEVVVVPGAENLVYVELVPLEGACAMGGDSVDVRGLPRVPGVEAHRFQSRARRERQQQARRSRWALAQAVTPRWHVGLGW